MKTKSLTADTAGRRHLGLILAATALWGLWLSNGLLAQTESPGPRQRGGDPPHASGFTPGLDDLMTLLVQPRHIRLFAAGTAENWELAAFELNELRSAFDRVSNTIPLYQGADVREGVDSMMARSLQETSDAIHTADVSRFTRAYENLTQACNGCHAYLEHPFLKIRVPQPADRSTAYPDQDFAPAQVKR